jgi:ABC-type cobalamin/Fe3+-siderophores transport system ATPase subunit
MKNGKILADGKPRKVLTPLLIQKTLGVEVEKLGNGKGLSVFIPKERKVRL